MNRKRRHLATIIAERPCGDCSVCCTALGVPEVTEPGEACQHLTTERGGCSIYRRRPKQCVAYQCLWRTGALTSFDRPDRVGFVLSVKVLLPGIRVLDCIEMREGAVDLRFDEVLAIAVHLGWVLGVKYLHTPEATFLYGPGAETILSMTDGVDPQVDRRENSGQGKLVGRLDKTALYVLPSGAGLHRLFLG